MYIEEMEAFLGVLAGRCKDPKTFQDEKKIIDALYQLEGNYNEKQTVTDI